MVHCVGVLMCGRGIDCTGFFEADVLPVFVGGDAPQCPEIFRKEWGDRSNRRRKQGNYRGDFKKESNYFFPGDPLWGPLRRARAKSVKESKGFLV